MVAKLTEIGMAPTLRPGADCDGRYGHALALIREHGFSVHAAAKESEIDPSNLRRRLNHLNATIPDAEQRHKAAEGRILSRAEEISEASAEKILDALEGDQMTPNEMIKAFSASTNQVAAKRRWSQGISTGDDRTQDALAGALQQLRDGKRIQITDPDPTDSAIDVTPVQASPNTTGEN